MNTLAHIEPPCVIDHAELLKRCMGNQPFAAKILFAFQYQLTGDLEELDEAIDSEDHDRIAAIAHRIKGSSSNVSAQRLNRAAASLENFSKGRPSGHHELRSLRDQIRSEHLSLVEATTNRSSTD